MIIEQQKHYKEENWLDSMHNRSFYLYKLKYPTGTTLPDFSIKFANDKIRQNILEIPISEEEKRKHLLVITKKEGDYLYGLFYKLKKEGEVSIIDEEAGTITLEQLEEQQAYAEKSRLIIDLTNKLIFGEYNDNGVRFFQQPFGEYLRIALNRTDLDIEVVYNKENYENLGNRDIKYFKIKLTKPKLKLMEDIFNLSGVEVFDDADDSESLTLEIKIKAGRKKSFNQVFVENVLNSFRRITDKSGIKKFEVGQTNFDIPLELVKDCILKRQIDIDNKTDEDIFEEIVGIYEELNLDELLDEEDDE
ncbi:MAG: hypothetical protein WC533_03495 [Candidatus Pacearchaeota archaeon]